jgi:hypothetical protein
MEDDVRNRPDCIIAVANRLADPVQRQFHIVHLNRDKVSGLVELAMQVIWPMCMA